MKILNITENDLDWCGDWLRSQAAENFIANEYTHISIEGAVVEAAVITLASEKKAVLLGEDLTED